MERQIKHTTLNTPRWNELTQEQRTKLTRLKKLAIEWMVKNEGRTLTFNELNKSGLFHWYTWFTNDYSAAHQWTKIKVSDTGVTIIRVN